MKTNKILSLMIAVILILNLLMPVSVLAKGENDFNAKLSVSDNSVPAGTTVTCSIKVTNTDPTYYADVTVQTSNGYPVDTFILMSGESRTIKHDVVIDRTTDINYKVIAYYGPDLSKSKNTNSVRVSAETQTPPPTTQPEPEPEPEPSTTTQPVLPAATEVPLPDPPEPINGMPCSGTMYTVALVDVTLNGQDANNLIAQTGDEVDVHCGVRFNIPDRVMADYGERSEEELAYVLLEIHSPSLSEPIEHKVGLNIDSGLLMFDDVLFMPEESVECFIFAYIVDPVSDSTRNDWQRKNLINGPDESEYDLWVDAYNVNGELVMPGESIDVVEGEEIHVTQMIHYSVPEGEFDLPEDIRVRMQPRVIVGGAAAGADYERVSILAEDTVGTFLLQADISEIRLGGRVVEFETFVDQKRYGSITPNVVNECSTSITINIVDESGWGAPADEEESPFLRRVFDGFLGSDFLEWLGFGMFSPSIDLIPDTNERVLVGLHDFDLSGIVEYNGPLESTIRLSVNEDFIEPMEVETSDGFRGTAVYRVNSSLDESRTIELKAELLNGAGEVVASDTESIDVVYRETPDDIDYSQEFLLATVPAVITQGDGTVISFGLDNNRSGQTVHVQIIDESDGSVVLEDTSLRPFGEINGVSLKTPDENAFYVYTAVVLADDGSTLWEQTKRVHVHVMPNRVEEHERFGEFNLNLGASDTVIAPGEIVRLYGDVHYGIDISEGPYETLSLEVLDQEDNVLRSSIYFEPDEVKEFSNDYELEATTTFDIKATAYNSDGTIAYEDMDSITIEVDEDEEPETRADGISSFDLDFVIVALDTVVAPGQEFGISPVVDNLSLSNEELYVELIDERSGDLVTSDVLTRGGRMMSGEIYSIDSTTTFSFTANAYLEDGTPVLSEHREVTIVVNESLIDDFDASDDYAIDLFFNAIENPIDVGDMTGFVFDAINVGREPMDIRILDIDDNVLCSQTDVASRDSYMEELFMGWSPEETSTVVIKAVGYIGDTEVCRDAHAVTVDVNDPLEHAYDIDLNMAEVEYFAEPGDTIDIQFELWHEGDEIVDVKISEDLTGWSEDVNDFDTIDTHDGTVSFLAEESATLIFRASSKVGDEVMYTDVETVEIIVADVDGADGDADGDDEADGDNGLNRDSDDSDDADLDEVVEPIVLDTADDLVSASVIPLSSDAGEDGSIEVVSITDQEQEETQRLYRARRWIAVGLLAFILLLIGITIYLTVCIKKSSKK